MIREYHISMQGLFEGSIYFTGGLRSVWCLFEGGINRINMVCAELGVPLSVEMLEGLSHSLALSLARWTSNSICPQISYGALDPQLSKTGSPSRSESYSLSSASYSMLARW